MKRYPLIGANGVQVGKSIDLANAVLFLKTASSNTSGIDTWILMKFGEGDLSWTISQEPTYERNRKKLDDVTSGIENPLEVSFEGKATFVCSSGTEPHTIHEILTGRDFTDGSMQFYGTAENWLSEYGCPPYAAELEFHMIPQIECPLSTVLGEAYLFRYFRASSIGWSVSSKRVSVRGASHVLLPLIQRYDFASAYSVQLAGGSLLESEMVPIESTDGLGAGTFPVDPRSI